MTSQITLMNGKIQMTMDMEIIRMHSQMKIHNGPILMKMDTVITLKGNNPMIAQNNMELLVLTVTVALTLMEMAIVTQ